MQFFLLRDSIPFQDKFKKHTVTILLKTRTYLRGILEWNYEYNVLCGRDKIQTAWPLVITVV